MQGDSALGRALGLVRELRQRCAWDRAQTPQTLRPYLVEEALELDHAIQTDDPEAMRDERFEPLTLLVDEQFRVTDDVDEQDVPDLKFHA